MTSSTEKHSSKLLTNVSIFSEDLDRLILLLIQQTTFIWWNFISINFHMREYSLEHEHSIILRMFEPSFHDKSSHSLSSFSFFFFTLYTHICTHIFIMYEQQDEWKVFLHLKYLEEKKTRDGGNKFIHKC